jgi:alkylated DNA repair dioxygenase AlkB
LHDVIESPVRYTKEKAMMGHFKPRDERSFDWTNQEESTFNYGGQKYKSHPATKEETDLSIKFLEIIKNHLKDAGITTKDLKFDPASLVPDQGVNIHYSAERHRGGHVSKHSDDEDDEWFLVLAYSLGQTRAFKVTSKDGKLKYCVRPKHNSLLVMIGKKFQSRFVHEVPKFTKATPNENIGSRVSWNVRYKPNK